ncbi:peroxide stress protein YaaA [Pseudooceanicola sp. HF7]|uniref:peroxide stress protein YaaA n=1 Tax=Pseudooceanicola sp. HF7 TaxID=2721560 RepID=UPI0014305259|nr:peroxide stress protein YaaA [Pseudooceanicola sp. HF7]NIZ09693.1 peroxide stress protein YaaA [Pseudooceanicola sp. HF7]
MLIVISPAKRLDWAERDLEMTEPDFGRESRSLAATMRQKSLKDLRELMDLSEDLAKLNRDRFRDFQDAPDAEALRPAVLAFAGDTYQGLEAQTLDSEEMSWTQEHLRILSGLYGVLRPLDGIQPYRLEMGTRLKTRRGTNLYQYWRDEPAKALNAQAEEVGTEFLVNCASQEYFGAVDQSKLDLKVITPVFLDTVKGREKVISFNAKRARGAMARFIVTHRLTTVDGLKDFDSGGYEFQPDRSTETELIFLRDASRS